jgi:fumarylacetoacetate (FAA) hydrolase
MKLATYADGTRDGHLVVVSHDLSTAVYANTQATRLQQLLDDWNFVAPQLHELYVTLNHSKARHTFAFDPALCMAPLPRVGNWSWQALGVETPPAERAGGAVGAGATDAADLADPALAPAQADAVAPAAPRAGRAGWTRPLLQAGAGDDMHGPRGELALPDGRWPGQVHAGLAVLTGELALQAGPSQAVEAVRLLGLYSRWSLATPAGEAQGGGSGGGSGSGAGFGAGAGAQLAPHWAPVLVTPDELGDAWKGGRIDLTLELQWLSVQGKSLGTPRLARGGNQRWHYGQLLAWACRLRRLRAGASLGCDWLSAALPQPCDLFENTGAAAPAARRGNTRAADAAASGPAYAARLDMLGRDGQSLFGQIGPSWLQADEADLPAAAGRGEARADTAVDSPPPPAAVTSDAPAIKRARSPRTARAGRPPAPEVERTIDPA